MLNSSRLRATLPALRQPHGRGRFVRGLVSARPLIQENDVVILRQRSQRSSEGRLFLSPPLRPGKAVKLAFGAHLDATALIGQRRVLDCVTDSKGKTVDIYDPSMAAYIRYAPGRLATPIYPQDASLIVSLLDVHPSPPEPSEETIVAEDAVAASRAEEEPGKEDREPDEEEPIEIFEAGTGMGSVTLHLARTIHAANPAVPKRLRKVLGEATYVGTQNIPVPETPAHLEDKNGKAVVPSTTGTEADPHRLVLSPTDHTRLRQHLARRRAVIHTLDVNQRHSRYAHGVIRQFRHAQYLLDIDFHVGTIEGYISPRLAETSGKPFLTHALLDLPSAEINGESVFRALKPNGTLVVFYPSISQIMEFVKSVSQRQRAEHYGPGGDRSYPVLRLERVLELPMATSADDSLRVGTGGRDWDVRLVRPRVKKEASPEEDRVHDEDEEATIELAEEVSSPSVSLPSSVSESQQEALAASKRETQSASPQENLAQPQPQTIEDKDVMVCRPQVFTRIVGGGFVAVFRRMLDIDERTVHPGTLPRLKPKAEPKPEPTEATPETTSDTTPETTSDTTPEITVETRMKPAVESTEVKEEPEDSGKVDELEKQSI